MDNKILRPFLNFPEEAKIIGRLLAGYGELEFDLCSCVGHARNDFDMVFKAMFRTTGEKARIDVGDAIGRYVFKEFGLETQFSEAVADTHHCRKIRNQYAHCHWVDDNTGSLGFVNLSELAKRNAHTDLLQLETQYIDSPILQAQEQFFKYVLNSLMFLNYEAQRLTGKSSNPLNLIPKKVARPSLYIP